MRYPAKKQHPLGVRLEEALWLNKTGGWYRAQKLLDSVCTGLDRPEEELEQENEQAGLGTAGSFSGYDYGLGHYDEHGYWEPSIRVTRKGSERLGRAAEHLADFKRRESAYEENTRKWDDWRKERDLSPPGHYRGANHD